ncbi:hypothetical protein [Paraburkholderia monticola]|nr:hypothetical protein [Paraburkholderia monticola]
MATNDFQTFAAGGGANVLTQAQYLALSSILANGFSAGVAPSAQLNKVWRQSSIMSAVLGQLIVNTTGQNATDDGTTATLLTNLINAISANSESVIGGVRNLAMNIATASASATLTADEIIVGSALGGLKYTLASFSKTINLATTGAGGMDTGSAPASGFVAIYAIYNPTTQTAALLATNAATKQGNVYGGANPPAGYTASALVSVWQTNSSGQLTVGTQEDRSISTVSVGVLTSSTTQSTPVALTISSAVPANARSVSGYLSLGSTSISSMFLNLFSSSASTGQQTAAGTVSAGTSLFTTFRNLQMVSAQTLFYTAGNGAGTPTFSITVSGYDF